MTAEERPEDGVCVEAGEGRSTAVARVVPAAVGEEVRILSGPLENFTGTVEEIDAIRAKLRVKVKMFLGREMQVEVDMDQVQKLD